VQELVNRPDWREGGAVLFLVTGSGERSATTYDTDPARAPVLYIEYTSPTMPRPVQTQLSEIPADEPIYLPLITR
jgi:hypothetical protein